MKARVRYKIWSIAIAIFVTLGTLHLDAIASLNSGSSEKTASVKTLQSSNKPAMIGSSNDGVSFESYDAITSATSKKHEDEDSEHEPGGASTDWMLLAVLILIGVGSRIRRSKYRKFEDGRTHSKLSTT